MQSARWHDFASPTWATYDEGTNGPRRTIVDYPRAGSWFAIAFGLHRAPYLCKKEHKTHVNYHNLHYNFDYNIMLQGMNYSQINSTLKGSFSHANGHGTVRKVVVYCGAPDQINGTIVNAISNTVHCTTCFLWAIQVISYVFVKCTRRDVIANKSKQCGGHYVEEIPQMKRFPSGGCLPNGTFQTTLRWWDRPENTVQETLSSGCRLEAGFQMAHFKRHSDDETAQRILSRRRFLADAV